MKSGSATHRKTIDFACAVLMATAVSATAAQAVYKCRSGRSVVYSHEPCIDAQVVDITPTQGMDKFGGTSRKGADVQRIEHRKMMAEALKPLTGMDERQFDKASSRSRLEPGARQECDRLDVQLPRQEASAATGTDPAGRKNAADAAALFESRKRYRRIGC